MQLLQDLGITYMLFRMLSEDLHIAVKFGPVSSRLSESRCYTEGAHFDNFLHKRSLMVARLVFAVVLKESKLHFLLGKVIEKKTSSSLIKQK